MLEILSIGSGCSLQDAGRAGWRRFGVPIGGAMDQRSMALANKLLGNSTDACVLEIVQLGTVIQAVEDTWIALAGADFCSRVPTGTAVLLRSGEHLCFDQVSPGLYAYLAVPGGLVSERWFGSASSDRRNGMGRGVLKGDRLIPCLAQPIVSIQGVARRITSEPLTHLPSEREHFGLYPGIQYEAFAEDARRQFIESEWIVSAQSDRTGYRLQGGHLPLPDCIPSEPVLSGSFQVPGDGQPIVTLHDGPTVGGYPKIAVLRSSDLDRFAQCAPGTRLSFSWID